MQLLKLLQVILMAAFEICGLVLIVLAVRFFWWRDKRDEDFAELVERRREEQTRSEQTAQEQLRNQQSRSEQVMQEQPSKRVPTPQELLQNEQRQDEWAALNRLRDEIERRERQANPRGAKPILKNGVYRRKQALFGPWPLFLHQNDEQYARYVRSRCQPIQLKLEDDHPYTIIGTSGEYKTSLRSCTCMDFRKNLQGLAPCKHMYFLARQCGYEVDAIFVNYQEKARR